jgi:hypothetical protein
MSENVKWTELVNKSVHTADDIDIGDIEAVSRNFIVIKRGFIHVHHYYIPVGKAEGWDGNVLWIKPTEEQVKEKYERNVDPNPASYYLKDQSMYNAASYPKVPTLALRYRAPVYPSPSIEEPRAHRCALCDMAFENEDELASHVIGKH